MLTNPAVKFGSLEVQCRSLVVGNLLRRRHLIQSTTADTSIDASLLEGKYFLLVEEDCFQSGQSLFYGQIPIHFFSFNNLYFVFISYLCSVIFASGA